MPTNRIVPDPGGGANKPIPAVLDLGPIVAEVISRLDDLSQGVNCLIKAVEVPQGLLTRQQAATYLACSPTALNAFTKSGRLKCVKIDSWPRYRVEDLDQFVEQHVTSAPEGGAA